MLPRIALCLLVFTVYRGSAEVDIITEPRPGEEYVLVSSGNQTPVRNFETSHKIPDKHPQQHRLTKPEYGNEKITKKLHSGKAKHPTEGIVSIEEDKKEILRKGSKDKLESVEIDVPVSKLEDIKIKENVKDVETNPKMAVALEAMSESGKLSNTGSTTTQKPVLTTAPTAAAKGYEYIPINFDSIDDINTGLLSSNAQLEPAGSEQKQHSRIQIKKGPNGQDYEYEYVYYYYDEEENKKEGKNPKEKPSTPAVHNSHDGPQKVEADNQIAKEKSKLGSKYSTIDRSGATTAAAPELHKESAPARGRQRGHTVAPAPVDEKIEEDRLPSSTRFPPRGRNLAATSTTYVPEVSSEVAKSRGRQQPDNVADESIGQTRSRTRSHIRRPSSELVDLDSFKTNSGDIPSQYKEPPTRYSSESKTTTEVPEITTTIKESIREGHSIIGALNFLENLDDSKLPPDFKETTPFDQETTEYTTVAAMEKVALDLYAYLAMENLNNEVNSEDFESTTTTDDVYTTEAMSTTEPTTTTTTTTTTTPAPTTTTTTTAAPSTRASRFRVRPGARARASSTSAATEAPQETSTKTRGRFSKPGVRKTSTTAAAVDASTSASAEKPVTKQAFGRRGLYAGRTKPSSTTTPAPAQDSSSSAATGEAAAVPRPRTRPGLKKTTTTSGTPAPGDAAASANSGEPQETTAAPARPIGVRGVLRPAAASLRPGPRLNLRPGGRLRPGLATTEPAPTSDGSTSDASTTDAPAESSSAAAPVADSGRVRLRARLSPSPKPRAPVTPPPRRVNPLLKRKPTPTEAPTETTKKETIEDSQKSESSESEKNFSHSESEVDTEEPVATETTAATPLRGLDAFVARRRLAGGIGARLARPQRNTHTLSKPHIISD